MRSSLLALALASTHAMCPNSCSGHGSCGNDDLCHCYTDWLSGDEAGGDCSERRCPYELAWFDTPSGPGKAHHLAECAGRGICDRATGDCQCFDGFTGKGCRRTTCPNDCSGHGTCEYISEFRTDLGDSFKLTGDAPTTDQFNHSYYKLFDYGKTMGCRCDPKWTDLDCSRRMCPKGSYALYDDSMPTFETQSVTITGYKAGSADEFALTFRTTLNEEYTTKKLIASPWLMPADVENALNELPNKVVEDVDVIFTDGAGHVKLNYQNKPSWEWHFTQCGDYGTTTTITPRYGVANTATLTKATSTVAHDGTGSGAAIAGSDGDSATGPTCDSSGVVFFSTLVDAATDYFKSSQYVDLGSSPISLFTDENGKVSAQVIFGPSKDGSGAVVADGLSMGLTTAATPLFDIGGNFKATIVAGKVYFNIAGVTSETAAALTGTVKELTVSVDLAGSTANPSTAVVELWQEGTAVTMATTAGAFGTPTWSANNWVGRTTAAETLTGLSAGVYEFVNGNPAAPAAGAAGGEAFSFGIETVRLWAGITFTAADIIFKGGDSPDISMDITFMGASTTGDQYGLECRSNQCADGCQPKLANAIKWHNSSDISTHSHATCLVGEKVIANSANLECSGRGRCDYGSGICECFTGYTDEYCSTQSALI